MRQPADPTNGIIEVKAVIRYEPHHDYDDDDGNRNDHDSLLNAKSESRKCEEGQNVVPVSVKAVRRRLDALAAFLHRVVRQAYHVDVLHENEAYFSTSTG